MPEMIQMCDLVDFECPNCGYIAKGKRGTKMNCPKCQPDFKGYILGAKNTEQPLKPDSAQDEYMSNDSFEEAWLNRMGG